MLHKLIIPFQAVVMACSFGSPMQASVIGGVELPADVITGPGFNAKPLEAIVAPGPDKGHIVVKPDHPVLPVVMATYGDWTVFRGGAPAECWIASLPQVSAASKAGKPVEAHRGDMRVFLSYQSGRPFEFSWESGYPIDKQTGGVLTVAGVKYRLNSESQTAWLEDQALAVELVEGMRGANTLQISAKSQRGTETEDEYSLIGLSDALAHAERLCAVSE